MKMRILVSLIVLLSFAALYAFANVHSESKGKSDDDELKLQVAMLEKRVAALEERLQKQPLAPGVLVPQALPNTDELPKGRLKKKFNGITYYIVPIQEKPAK
jgi:hypothetical protein